MIVKDYTEEFYKLVIWSRHSEEDMEKIARYMNGLKYSLQDELSLVSPRSLKEAYQLALKAEEKLQRKQSQQERKRGRGQQTGRE